MTKYLTPGKLYCPKNSRMHFWSTQKDPMNALPSDYIFLEPNRPYLLTRIEPNENFKETFHVYFLVGLVEYRRVSLSNILSESSYEEYL